MITNTALTDAQREYLWMAHLDGHFISGDQGDAIIKEIEQAVLQSPGVRALREDAKRWEAMRQCFIGVEYDSPTEGMALFTCHIPQYQYRSGDPNKIADAAMEKQP